MNGKPKMGPFPVRPFSLREDLERTPTDDELRQGGAVELDELARRKMIDSIELRRKMSAKSIDKPAPSSNSP